MTLREALQVLVDECLEDHIYDVMESEGLWREGPRVIACVEALGVIEGYLKEGADG